MDQSTRRGRFAVGDFVRYAHPNGSTGKVVSIRTDGPFADNPAPLVEWVYGRDNGGEPMHARSMIYDPLYKLEIVTEADYLAVRDRKA